jgi:hypothetical protein
LKPGNTDGTVDNGEGSDNEVGLGWELSGDERRFVAEGGPSPDSDNELLGARGRKPRIAASLLLPPPPPPQLSSDGGEESMAGGDGGVNGEILFTGLAAAVGVTIGEKADFSRCCNIC